MYPVFSAIGVILVSLVLTSSPFPGIKLLVDALFGDVSASPLTFLAGTAVAAGAAFLLGRFVLPRLPWRFFGRLATGTILLLQGAVLVATSVPATGTVWGEIAPVFGLLPGVACYLACAAGSHRRVAGVLGVPFLDWLSPRLFLVPQGALLFLVTPRCVQAAIPQLDLYLARNPGAEVWGSLAWVVLAVMLAPLAFRFLFPVRPMPAELAGRLAAMARRAGVRVYRVLVWQTGARPILTACVVGLFPWTRHIFFTSALLEALTPEEVEAVFAHELAHVRRRHFFLILLFAGGFFAVLSGLLYAMDGLVGESLVYGVALLLLAFFLLGPFARVSRILELEADLSALDLGADPQAFTQALERVRHLSGSDRNYKGHSWRHFSIPYRVQAVRESLVSADFWQQFRRRRRAALATIALTVAAGATVLALSGSFEASSSPPSQLEKRQDEGLRRAAALIRQARFRSDFLDPAQEELESLMADLREPTISPALSGLEYELTLVAGRRFSPYSLYQNPPSVLRREVYRQVVFELAAEFYGLAGRAEDARRAAIKARYIKAKLLILVTVDPSRPVGRSTEDDTADAQEEAREKAREEVFDALLKKWFEEEA